MFFGGLPPLPAFHGFCPPARRRISSALRRHRLQCRERAIVPSLRPRLTQIVFDSVQACPCEHCIASDRGSCFFAMTHHRPDQAMRP
jgi:hypothetical protein